ncbi:YlmH/Sll1252 family protein [Desulfitobacterium sp. AusDCA]|uniref:YlmH/Sll1252 family protein n=1 Tax=Desulfitobacterium sp. AusDCA TaxID=3240383 RepID=UPI003DA73BFE
MKQWIDRSVLAFWQDKEMRLEAAHLLDIADEVIEEHLPKRTPFLGRALAQWFEGVLKKEHLMFLAEGGFEDSERVVYLLGGNQGDFERVEDGIALLTVNAADPKAALEHRQILGSLMSLGLKRELIGDIRHGLQGMVVAVAEEIAPYLLQEWRKAGKVVLNVQRQQGELYLCEDPGEEIRITVASSRIDAVAAAGFKAARGVVQEWINQGKVKRNDLIINKTDLEVKLGDIISCRGQGRFRLLETSETRKGRIAWKVALYRKQKR